MAITAGRRSPARAWPGHPVVALAAGVVDGGAGRWRRRGPRRLQRVDRRPDRARRGGRDLRTRRVGLEQSEVARARRRQPCARRRRPGIGRRHPRSRSRPHHQALEAPLEAALGRARQRRGARLGVLQAGRGARAGRDLARPRVGDAALDEDRADLLGGADPEPLDHRAAAREQQRHLRRQRRAAPSGPVELGQERARTLGQRVVVGRGHQALALARGQVVALTLRPQRGDPRPPLVVGGVVAERHRRQPGRDRAAIRRRRPHAHLRPALEPDLAGPVAATRRALTARDRIAAAARGERHDQDEEPGGHELCASRRGPPAEGRLGDSPP